MKTRSTTRLLILLTLTLASGWSIGCKREPPPPTFEETKLPSDDALRDRIDAMVDHTRDNRILNTGTHNAWQIVHGILPYGFDFKVEHQGEIIGALQYLLDGGELKGWELRPGDKGVLAVLAPGSKAAQGHPDQWIGYLSQCGLKTDQKLVVGAADYTLKDLLNQAQWDLYPKMEASWTLMALSAFEPWDYSWTAKDGEQWTVERLLEMECEAPIVGEDAACGGTHRMYAITLALNNYLGKSGATELTGGWKKADDLVQDCIAKAKKWQQPNGSFSTNFFAGPGSSPDVDNTLHATGHTLEWLVLALNNEQFKEPWVRAAALRTVELLENNQDRELDCGALYHAARGLMLYRLRQFGPREPVAAGDNSKAQAAEPADDSKTSP